MLLKNSHNVNDAYFTQTWNGKDGVILTGAEAQPDFVGPASGLDAMSHADQQFGFTPEILEHFYAKGCEWVKLELQPGDLVVWYVHDRLYPC